VRRSHAVEKISEREQHSPAHQRQHPQCGHRGQLVDGIGPACEEFDDEHYRGKREEDSSNAHECCCEIRTHLFLWLIAKNDRLED
jgi:hypothetical protein